MEVVGTLVIVAIVVVLGVLADRRFGILPRGDRLRPEPPRKPALAFQAGEAPATALAPNAAALARLRAVTPRCGADGAAMTPSPDDTVRYNDRELLVLRFRCPQCGAARAIYCQTDRVQPAV
jgi:hypothetical protein